MAKDDIALRILHGKSIEIPELDEELQKNIDIEALIKYEIYLLSESIGTNSFEDNYFLFKDDIFDYEIESKKLLCNRILSKLEKVYEFGFSDDLNLNTFEDRNWLLEFINFVEFDNIDLLIELFYTLDVSLFKIDLEHYLKEKRNEVIFTLQSLDLIYTYNKLILDFLINYNSDDLIKWLIRQTEKNKIEIQTNLQMKKGV